MAKSSISEVLPIEDKTSSVNFVDSFPEGEAKDKERAQKGMVICKDFLFGSKLFSVICSRGYCMYSRAYFSA